MEILIQNRLTKHLNSFRRPPCEAHYNDREQPEMSADDKRKT